LATRKTPKAGWEYEAPYGSIDKAANKVVHMANVEGQTFTLIFNEKRIQVSPKSLVKDVIQAYWDIVNREQEEWNKTPEGKAHKVMMAEAEKRTAEFKKEPLHSFVVRGDKQDEWHKQVEMNDDDYGSCCIRYIARWANYMERELAKGAELEQIAKACGHEADKEGITGFMYGVSVNILSQVWVHGEELRKWHNLDTQMGNEGEKANENGGVLNPALIGIGGGED